MASALETPVTTPTTTKRRGRDAAGRVKHQKHLAIYLRVSSEAQDHRSQLPDLERWAAGQETPVVWYSDKITGKSMDRPGWNKLQAAIGRREVAAICCWRMDRLGRTASGLTALFDELQQKGINLVSLKEGIDLSNPAGRMMANVLASVAQFETEVRGERVRAGQAAARAAGKRWGGSKPGRHGKVTREKVRAIRKLKADGVAVASISRTVGVSRQTIYTVLNKTRESCQG